MAKRLHTVIALALVLSSAAWARRDPKPGWNLFSKEQDVQLGREAAAQVERQMQVVNNSDLQAYVQRVGQRLASQPEAGGYPYTFKVVNDPSINAFALPGGPLFVHSGLIKAAENESQLAGVLAHEISHVALRHGTNQASKANLIQLPAMIAGAVVGNGSMLGQLAQLGIGLGANSVLLKYSRDAESDADILGARIMAKAGYNPIEMARFFEKLEAEGGSRGPQFLSDHPNPGNRLKAIQEEIRYLPQTNYNAGDSAGFQQAKSLVGGLPQPSTRSRQSAGVTGGGGDPRPSGGMQTYQGREFSISHPGNWEVFGDNQSAAVTIAPRAGLAQDRDGNVQIAYGLMASYYSPQHTSRGDLRNNTSDLIGQLRQSNPSMQLADNRQRSVKIGGSAALVTKLASQSPAGGREVDTLVTVDRPQGVFYMIFIAPEKDSSALDRIYDEMLRSVRFR